MYIPSHFCILCIQSFTHSWLEMCWGRLADIFKQFDANIFVFESVCKQPKVEGVCNAVIKAVLQTFFLTFKHLSPSGHDEVQHQRNCNDSQKSWNIHTSRSAMNQTQIFRIKVRAASQLSHCDSDLCLLIPYLVYICCPDFYSEFLKA